MTFKEYLQEDEGRMIKVGSKNGDGFFYIGSADNFLRQEKRYEAAAARYLVKSVEAAESRLRTSIVQMEKAANMDKNAPDYEKIVAYRTKDVSAKERTLASAQRRLSRRVPLMDRKVVRNYPANGYDIGYMIVIIDGGECGAYWTADETTPMTRMQFRSGK